MGKESPKKSDSTGEWRARTGLHRPIDTGVLRTLDGTPPAEEPQPQARGDDPYNQTIPPLLDPTVKQKRPSSDDLRRLSEEIKAYRSKK